MISDWLANGDLPAGIHWATWREVETRLGFNARRRQLFNGFRRGCDELRRAGCRLVYLDGSFVTSKEEPADFDACWDIQNVDDSVLDPVFFVFANGRAEQKKKFMGEFFPAELPEGATGKAFVEFFQINKVTGTPKGIVALRIGKGRK
jgi:hypothetical protein